MHLKEDRDLPKLFIYHETPSTAQPATVALVPNPINVAQNWMYSYTFQTMVCEAAHYVGLGVQSLHTKRSSQSDSALLRYSRTTQTEGQLRRYILISNTSPVPRAGLSTQGLRLVQQCPCEFTPQGFYRVKGKAWGGFRI